MTDDELTRAGAALDDRFGADRAEAFAAELPGRVAELVDRWGLRLGHLFDSGASSVVIAALARDGRPAAVKLSPDAPFLTRQGAMLRHLEPTQRAPRVLAEDPATGTLLLERVLPGDTLDSSRSAPPTTTQWAALLGDLHGTSAEGVEDTLHDRCGEMVERIGARQQRPHVRKLVADQVWERAVGTCRELLQTQGDRVVIHGDLHLGNVVDGGDQGLVVIDPKLCVGDPCFDMVDFVVTSGTAPEMLDRGDDLAALTGTDPQRLRAWVGVNAVVTTVSRLAWAAPDERTATLLELAEQL